MNIQRTTLTIGSVITALSLPLSLSLPVDDAPSLSPSLPPSHDAFVQGDDSTLIYPAQLPPCDNEDGTAVSNHMHVPACVWSNGGETFIVLAATRWL